MSGFGGSIDDLMEKDESVQPSAPAEDRPTLRVANEATADAFSKKMEEIHKKEFETKAKRAAKSGGDEYPYINLQKFPISQEALRQIPREKVEELRAVCFFVTPDQFRLGAVDPEDERIDDLLYELEERNHAEGMVYTISEASYQHVHALYSTLPIVKPISKDIEISAESLEAVQADITNFEEVQGALKGKSTTEMITVVLGAGLKLDASDVHIESEEAQIVVRFRIDGVLYDVANLDRGLLKRLVSRIKLVSSLKINITTKPQDGRFTIKLPEGDVDVRVSVIPTVHGESVVMRLLKQNQEGLTLDSLGMRGAALELLKQEIVRPNGMILTTGPTGSGKTTTLYSVMKILNKPGVKIVTLEDPVEYRIEGVNQSQIDRSTNYTFAKGLRSLLRQDPDIVMVGEIRDLETADIAVQASLTGHLMLSTVHTNSAAGAIPRLLAMGVKPFLLTPALNAVIGQRLVRRIADESKVEKRLEEFEPHVQEQITKLLDTLPEAQKKEVEGKEKIFYVANPKDVENGVGYKGRIGIYEIFRMTPEIESLISSGNISEYEVEQTARAQGMITMAQDGILKALDGLTSVEEVFRVIE